MLTPQDADHHGHHEYPPFKIAAQDRRLQGLVASPSSSTPDAPLGLLENLQDTEFFGYGFNAIFRPDNTATPTPFSNTPNPLPPDLATGPNVLELNLTHEYLTFHKPLHSVPNRGANNQGDIFLNGLPYTQRVYDVTDVGSGLPTAEPDAIHFETGIWMHIPATTVDPVTPESYCRMASIPHGTTVNAQGILQSEISTAPEISSVDMTPSICIPNPSGGPPTPGPKKTFPSQDAANQLTFRLPQDLTAFINAGRITQDILNDPTTLLTTANTNLTNQGLKITNTITFSVSTDPNDSQDSGLTFTSGGGTANINFLDGSIPEGKVTTQTLHNALVPKMIATFWIETVQTTFEVGPWTSGSPPIKFTVPGGDSQNLRPTFVITPSQTIPAQTPVTATYLQLQYRQTVFLRFEGFLWPHVSVATLIPKGDIPWTVTV